MRTSGFLLALVATFALPAAASAATYLPVGPQTNVALATVLGGGWSVCYSGTFAAPLGSSASDEIAGCSGTNLMYAGRATGSDTLLLLAQAQREDVTFDTGINSDVTHNANGSEWYFSDNYSVGFAEGGADVSKNECDTLTGNFRLCLHTVNGAGGYRIGDIQGLNGSTNFEKLILVSDVAGAVPEPGTWAMMLLGFGAMGVSMRRRRRTQTLLQLV